MRGGLALAAALVVTPSASANSLGNVDDPEIKSGEMSLHYRAAFTPEHDGSDYGFAHTLFGQASLGENWRIRVGVVQERDFEGNLSFRSIEPEVWWQIKEGEGRAMDIALIAKGYIPDQGDGPGMASVAVALANNPMPRVRLVFNAEAGRWIGDDECLTPDGFFLASRAEASYEVSGALSVGAQMFNDFGSTNDFEPFNHGAHQIGPVARLQVFDGVSVSGSVLFAMSEAAPDTEFRTFLSFSF